MTDQPSGLRARIQRRRADFSLDMDIALPARGITALFGASGAGKTSCLRAIAGLERDIDGQISFDGQVWHDSATSQFVPTSRRRIGYVFQEASLFSHLSVVGNLDYGARRNGRGAAIDRARLLEQFGVDALLARKVSQLSGGERQRVAIVRALLSAPALLLLDEPLSGLDTSARNELLTCLEQWHADMAVPTIFVSHAIDEVARLADHLVVIDAGQVVAQGPLQATLASGQMPPALMDALGVVIEGVVASQDSVDHLIELTFHGGSLWLPQRREQVGDGMRARVSARDVVLSLSPPHDDGSALNTLSAVIVGVLDAAHPAQCIVQLDVRGTALLASITWRSWRALGLSVGAAVWAQVKATALGG